MLSGYTKVLGSLSIGRATQMVTVSSGLLLFVVVGYCIYQRLFSPLSRIPGPFWASLTPLWKLLSFKNGNFHETIVSLHQKYGKLVRIAPNEVIISDGAAIRQIYSTTEGKDFLKVAIITMKYSIPC